VCSDIHFRTHVPIHAERRTIEGMAQVHITEAELARDLYAVLEQVRQGAEVIVPRRTVHMPRSTKRSARISKTSSTAVPNRSTLRNEIDPGFKCCDCGRTPLEDMLSAIRDLTGPEDIAAAGSERDGTGTRILAGQRSGAGHAA
jgi:hypothetical protein